MSQFLRFFRPDILVDSIYDIDIVELRAEGINTIMLDLDNTMLPWRDSEVSDPCSDWIENTKRQGMKICIVSNTHKPKRLKAIAEKLDIPAIHRALKPRRYGFGKALMLLGAKREETVVVGDQLLTDIFGGNRAGMKTILVKPMHPKEFIGTKLSRIVERGILRLLTIDSRTGTKSPSGQSEKTQDEE